MSSIWAQKLYAALASGEIKSRSAFWRNYFDVEKIASMPPAAGADLEKRGINLACCFDEDFPHINGQIKLGERPFLLAYKGDISLLNDVKNNMAVVGSLAPDERILAREKNVIEAAVKKKWNIVSGLARGCDSAAHRACLDAGGKTIAILPTTIDNVYPPENAALLDEIVKRGGLVVTEYVTEPKSYNEKIARFIERDRLQAMFSRAVVLIASHVKGEGDSGSRHAMHKAAEYGVSRYVMYNASTDELAPIFALNRAQMRADAKVLTPTAINQMREDPTD